VASLIDDITEILTPGLSLVMSAAIETITEWLQKTLGIEDSSLNRKKP